MYGSEMNSEFVNKKEERIQLELCPPKDVAAVAKAMAKMLDCRVRAFLNVGPMLESDEVAWFSGQKERKDCIVWSICANGEMVGNCGLHSVDLEHRNAEMGLMIANKGYWGRGIACVAEAMITEYASREIIAGGLHKITAYVFVNDDGSGNDASRAAIKKVGYREVGVFRQHRWILGRWYDEWACELLMDEWRSIRLEVMKKVGIKKLDLYPGLEDKGFRPILIE